jgi:hypothetical protein
VSHIPTVTAMYEAIRRGDLASLLTKLNDDCVWENPGPPHGRVAQQFTLGTDGTIIAFCDYQDGWGIAAALEPATTNSNLARYRTRVTGGMRGC